MPPREYPVPHPCGSSPHSCRALPARSRNNRDAPLPPLSDKLRSDHRGHHRPLRRAVSARARAPCAAYRPPPPQKRPARGAASPRIRAGADGGLFPYARAHPPSHAGRFPVRTVLPQASLSCAILPPSHIEIHEHSADRIVTRNDIELIRLSQANFFRQFLQLLIDFTHRRIDFLAPQTIPPRLCPQLVH